MSGRVAIVGAGPGEADLITVRGLRALRSADVVLYDHLVDERLLEGLDAELVYVGKRCGRHSMAQEAISGLLVAYARAGHRVVRLKGGDPMVLGRAGEEAARLAEEGIPYEVVPGVSSAVAGPAFAGIPVTHRGLADSVHVVSAHRRGDEPDFSIPRYHERTTVVLLMAARTAEVWGPMLSELGYPGDLPVAFITAAGTPRQRVLETTVGEAATFAASEELGTPTLAVVGRVVRLRASLAWYERTLSAGGPFAGHAQASVPSPPPSREAERSGAERPSRSYQEPCRLRRAAS